MDPYFIDEHPQYPFDVFSRASSDGREDSFELFDNFCLELQWDVWVVRDRVIASCKECKYGILSIDVVEVEGENDRWACHACWRC